MARGLNVEDIIGVYLALRLSFNRYGVGFNFSFYVARLADGDAVAATGEGAVAAQSNIYDSGMALGIDVTYGGLSVGAFADEVKIAGQSGIASSIKDKGAIVQGPMAFDIRDYQRAYIIFKKLPQMYQMLNKLKKENDS